VHQVGLDIAVLAVCPDGADNRDLAVGLHRADGRVGQDRLDQADRKEIADSAVNRDCPVGAVGQDRSELPGHQVGQDRAAHLD
jgi:hypothetical protein